MLQFAKNFLAPVIQIMQIEVLHSYYLQAEEKNQVYKIYDVNIFIFNPNKRRLTKRVFV